MSQWSCDCAVHGKVYSDPFCPECDSEDVDALRERLAAAEKRAEVAEAGRKALAKQVAIAVEALKYYVKRDDDGYCARRALAAIAEVKP